MTNLDRISAPDYIPTEQDVLRVRFPTTGIHDYAFTIKTITLRWLVLCHWHIANTDSILCGKHTIDTCWGTPVCVHVRVCVHDHISNCVCTKPLPGSKVSLSVLVLFLSKSRVAALTAAKQRSTSTSGEHCVPRLNDTCVYIMNQGLYLSLDHKKIKAPLQIWYYYGLKEEKNHNQSCSRNQFGTGSQPVWLRACQFLAFAHCKAKQRCWKLKLESW